MKDFMPSKDEKKKLKKTVKSFLSNFKHEEAKFTLGGSYAKDTWLPGNKDIDVFVKFKAKKYRDENISSILYVTLRKKFKNVLIVHGSRDYFHVEFEGILFEVVPVLDVKHASEAENIMDVSPLHVKYVKRKVRHKDDVRKLKALLKANHLYGAESYLQGFSGYVCELLISYYGSFSKLIANVRKWNLKGIVLDVGKQYSSPSIALKSLNKSKLGILVLVDPVDKDRNAAASVSSSKFKSFVKLCSKFDGSEKFFVLSSVDVSKLKGYIVLNIVPLSGKKDISLAKMRALYDRIVREFSYYGFSVKDSGWDSGHYWFKVSKLSKTFKHSGPSLEFAEHVKVFRKKYKGKVKTSKGKVYVVLNREFSDPKKFLKSLIKEKFVKEKVKKAKIS